MDLEQGKAWTGKNRTVSLKASGYIRSHVIKMFIEFGFLLL